MRGYAKVPAPMLEEFPTHLRNISLLLLDAFSSADDGKTVEGQDTLGITSFVIN